MRLNPSYNTGFARHAHESQRPDLRCGLVGAWMTSLGETGGTLRDVSGHKSDGTLLNGAAWSMLQGRRCLSFDGVNDFVQMEAAALSVSRFTVAMWFRASSTPTSSVQLAIGNGGPVFLGEHFNFCWGHPSASFQQAWAFQDTASNFQAFKYPTLMPATWYHLALTWDGATAIAYLNGSPSVISPLALGPNTSPAYTLKLGAGDSGAVPFPGQIADVCIWNRALPRAAINSLYVDPLAAWRIADESILSGTTVILPPGLLASGFARGAA